MVKDSSTPFKRILIANRGEIAVRLMRACREMNIETVAVYSDADRAALHVRAADRAVHIGNSPPGESYLSIEALLDVAKQTRADAIHPGYGFLAENAAFAQAVVDAGIVFIGPSPFSIRAMGDKAEARERMIASGVPVVPGYQDADDEESVARAAEEIGYPVLLKAAAGGGGKAMRVVRAAGEMREMMEIARREAMHAFGDARLILEKYIENARHIEFQILADKFGNTVHLFERECSIQRRHQKIIEETPSPLLDDALREKMGSAAVAAARAVNYENAGTVEFIVDPDTATLRPGSGQGFYFLEMNTRLQVEHPITEMTTGIDLVQWQIRIAGGERLPVISNQLSVISDQLPVISDQLPVISNQLSVISNQSSVSSDRSSVSRLPSLVSFQPRGHALECRIYAEDPANHFYPSTGRVLEFKLPALPNVRADAGVARGDEVTAFYDPLLVKLVAYAETREGAIARMQNALREFVLLGVTTNIEFLQAVLEHPTFRAGQATTRFIERHFADWQPAPDVPQAVWLAAALADFLKPVNSASAPRAANDPFSPWQSGDAFRVGGATR